MDRRGFLGGLLALVGASRLVKAEPHGDRTRPRTKAEVLLKPGPQGYSCRYVFYDPATGLETPLALLPAEIHGRKVYRTR